jgi:pimeloyl-ACP methyl ester carboxylesterase
MKRPILIASLLSVLVLGAAGPAGACAAADGPCLSDPLAATVKGEVWYDYDNDGARGGDEHQWMSTGQVWADYNHDGERQPGETMVETERDGSYELPVDTGRLEGSGRADLRFRFARNFTLPDEFDTSCIAPAPGCVHSLDVTAGQSVGGVNFPIVGVAQLNGMIWDDKNDDGRRQAGEDGLPGLRVFLDDDNDGKLDPGEPFSHKTVPDGRYIFPIPTRYQAAGGNLPPLVLEEAPGADCSAPSDCAVRGLHTRTGKLTTADHGVARPVVIFLHGYGGSQIVCPGKLLWFKMLGGPDLMNMRLGADGQGLKVADGGTSCSQNSSVSGLVMKVGPKDIYEGASKHFEAIAWPGRHYDYIWDWRNSPESAVAGLDALIEKARCGGEAGCSSYAVKRVQLVAHSMGGLVIRHYIEDPARAEKVQRVVTVGTPYWGSPKPIFPLTIGQEVPYFSMMDGFMDDDGLKASARSFPGHFSLMPAFGYGKWLTVEGMNGDRQLDMDGVTEYLRRIGVDPAMYTRAAAAHGRVLDHFDDHGIDYHVIVGGGMATMGAIRLSYGIDDAVAVTWTGGDETVPAFAAAMDTPRDRLHYVCGVSHVPITADPQTTRLMDGFLIRGDAMRDEQASCDWSARELSWYYPGPIEPLGSASQAAAPRVVSGGKSTSLAAAEQAELVQVLRFGSSTKIVAAGGSDVRIELPAGGTATVRDLAQKGASNERRFALTGTTSLDLGGTGAVTRAGKPVKPSTKDRKAPVTRASVKRIGGGKLRLTLKARDASKVAASYVVVAGKKRIYQQPFVLTAKRLAKTTYGSVDIWGNAENPRKAPRR